MAIGRRLRSVGMADETEALDEVAVDGRLLGDVARTAAGGGEAAGTAGGAA